MLQNVLENLDWLFIFVGLPAQVMFMSRFLVQWLASEKQGKSVIPMAFWYLSLAGSLGLLLYGALRGEPVLIIGQAMPCAIYMRNLALISKEKKKASLQGDSLENIDEVPFQASQSKPEISVITPKAEGKKLELLGN